MERKIFVIHKRSSELLYKGDLLTIPGIGTKVHVDKKKYLDKIEAEVKRLSANGGVKVRGYDDHGKLPSNHKMLTNINELRGFVINKFGLNPNDFTTVIDIEHCLITGDIKVFVGRNADLDRTIIRTDSKMVKVQSLNSRSNDSDFLDGFLLSGLLMSD